MLTECELWPNVCHHKTLQCTEVWGKEAISKKNHNRQINMNAWHKRTQRSWMLISNVVPLSTCQWCLPESLVDLLHRTPLVPWCVCGLMLLLLRLPIPQRLMRARLAVVTLMPGRVCRLGFGRTRWRFLGGIRPLASIGLFDAHRSVAAAVNGCPPPAVCGPSRLGSVAHIGGFDHAIFYYLFLIFLFFVPVTHRWPHCAHVRSST